MERARLIVIAGTTVAAAYLIARWNEQQIIDADDEQSNVLEDAVNSVKNIISPNEISGVVEAGAGYLVVRRPDGSVQRLQGSRNWRNNNPGNIEYGAFARSMGAVGTDGRFAVFPTYAAGRAAKESLIFDSGSYANLSLSQAIARYAPASENDTSWYYKTVLSAAGSNKIMGQYTEAERSAILDAMQRVEGFKPGTVSDVSYA